MRILITNDDGVGASQLVPLIRLCRRIGEVTAVVPKYQQSGKSHGIELHRPFEVKEVSLASDVSVTTVDSTPADCVRFAVLGQKKQFDLVISGINIGLNIGSDIMYSGTVGAAFEAASLGINTLAISTSPDYYEYAIEHLPRVFSFAEDFDLFSHCSIYNVNIPKDAKDILFTRQGGPYYSDDFIYAGNDMYSPRGKCVYESRNDLSYDTDAVMNGYISVMPLTCNRTDMDTYRIILSQRNK